MAEKLSLLLFSRNDIDKALALIDDMKEYVDEIVLFDSSEYKEHARLLKEKAARKLSKLRVYSVVALGYLEPAIMYAFKKCRYNWIFLLGTDERVSPELKDDLHKLIKRTKASAFAPKRYEEVGKTSRSAYFNWQIRLFRKDKTQFRGMIHEEPIIDGDLERLSSEKYFIEHINELRSGTHNEYSKMEEFRRMSYGIFNEVMGEYLFKYMLPGSRGNSNIWIRWMYRMLTGYEIIKRVDPEKELSNFDYFLYYVMHAGATALRTRKLKAFIRIVPDALQETRIVREWKAKPDSNEIFEISKILHKEGLIKFLGLDKESTILKLNRKYRNKEQGVSLLMKLLKEKYREMKSGR